ncbi:MAG: menaquinone-specific isochorismate synthase [Glaciecola sp.]
MRRGEGLIGVGSALRIDPGAGPERFAVTRDRLEDIRAAAIIDNEVGLPGTGLVAFISHTFAPDAFGSLALIPKAIVGRRGGVSWLTTIEPVDAPTGEASWHERLPADLGDPPPPQDRPRFAGSSLPDLHWLVGVADAVARCKNDELEKVVLARDHALWARSPFQIRGITARLAARFPDCHTFAVQGLVGATPELLLRRFGDEVSSQALAGTARRGRDDAEDAELAAALLSSHKDAFEHRLAADSVDLVLRPRCRELQRSAPHLKVLDNLQHVATTFEGRLTSAEHLLDVVSDLHPTAAVGGTPTRAAMAMISELEQMDRGRYAGPVGWVDGNGDGEVGIALRCAELSGARARLFAGAGIVAESLPEDELEETRVKLRAMQSVLGAS